MRILSAVLLIVAGLAHTATAQVPATGSAGTIDDLSQHFVIQDGAYKPRDVRVGQLCCEYFLYFLTDTAGQATQLLLHVQYCADDPLRYREVAFIIGGEMYHIKTRQPGLKRFKRRYYMEVSDTPLDSGDTPLLDALLAGDEVTVRLTGADGMGHVMRLEPPQCININRAINLFRLLGGML